jgi:hypothetical protein
VVEYIRDHLIQSKQDGPANEKWLISTRPTAQPGTSLKSLVKGFVLAKQTEGKSPRTSVTKVLNEYNELATMADSV